MKPATQPAKKKSATKPAGANEVFVALRAILAEHVPPLRVLVDTPTDFQIVSATHIYKKRPLWIAGVRQGKNYTSFHFLPIYAFPQLADGLSPALKKRKQGKGCFNFKAVDEALFGELKKLADKAIPKFDSDALIAHVEKKTKKSSRG